MQQGLLTKNQEVVHSKIPCPNCPSSDGYYLYGDGHGYCFACSEPTWPEKEVIEMDDKKYTYEYLPWRGISKEVMVFFDAQTRLLDNVPVQLSFPYTHGAYKIRSLKEKKYHAEGEMVGPGLFGANKYPPGSAKAITIVEGEADCLAHATIFGLAHPVVSIKGAATAKRDCIALRDYLNTFSKIYLALDNDEPGQNAAREIATLFDFNKVYHVKFDGEYKDCLDFLEKGVPELYRRCWWNATRFLPTGVFSSYETIFGILKNSTNQKGQPYPFGTLNSLTQGIRTGESVLWTAQEGIGKTEVLRAVEYQIARNTDWPIGIIHLEEMKDRNVKGLIGQHLSLPVHLEDCNVSQSDMETAYRELSKTDDRIHFYSHFGSDDPNVILDTIRFLVAAAGCKLVTLDHINMVVSGLRDEDKTKALDYLATRLEMMVKELDFSLHYVAHVNDDGRTRDSRMISKVCDIRIDLFRDITNNNEVIRNTTSLTVSKNRPVSRTGPAGRLFFDPTTFKLRELTEDLPV